MRIKSVNSFLQHINDLHNQYQRGAINESYIFRGVSNVEWKLQPAMFRNYPEPQESSSGIATYEGAEFEENENEVIAHFKKEAVSYLSNVDLGDDFTWMQYAQHFGAPTRLLDFSTSPLVALYFCCTGKTKSDGAVWIIRNDAFERWSLRDEYSQNNKGLTRNQRIESIMKSINDRNTSTEGDSMKQRPVFYVPPYIDVRMSAQTSRFLLWGHDKKPLEEMVEEKDYMLLETQGVKVQIANDERFLTKLIIPSSSKYNILAELDLLGINEKSIYPGLDGIGRYVRGSFQRVPDKEVAKCGFGQSH